MWSRSEPVAVRRRLAADRGSASSCWMWYAVDLRNLLALLRLVLVVRDGVVRVRDADGGIRPVAQLAADQEGDHACDVGLPGEELQVEHQIDVLLEGVGDTEGHREVGRRLQVAPLRPLDAALHVPDRVEVLRHPARVGRTDGPLQAGGVAEHRIEDAAVLLQAWRAARPACPRSRTGAGRPCAGRSRRGAAWSACATTACSCRRRRSRCRSSRPGRSSPGPAPATRAASRGRAPPPRSGRR